MNIINSHSSVLSGIQSPDPAAANKISALEEQLALMRQQIAALVVAQERQQMKIVEEGRCVVFSP